MDASKRGSWLATMSGRGVVASGVLLAALLPACSPGDEMNGGPTEVVRIEASPTLVIGADDADPEGALRQVTDATFLPDGSVVVANGGLQSRLPVFSAAGAYVRTMGGQGDGPGEFRRITHLERGPADSLYVFDAAAQRLTSVAPDGRVRTNDFAVASGGTGSDGLGRVLRLGPEVWMGVGQQSPKFGEVGRIQRDTVAIGLLNGALDWTATLARLPALMSTAFELEGRPMFGSPAFSPSVLQATWGRCAFVGSGEGRSISVYSSEGDLVATLEGPGVERPVSDGAIEEWIEHRLQGVESDRHDSFRRDLREMARVAHLPYYHHMISDPLGRLWLQEYTPPVGLGSRWSVLSQAGRHLGDVVFPEPMRILEVEEDGVLGTTTGDLDEEYVVFVPFDDLPFSAEDALAACRPVGS